MAQTKKRRRRKHRGTQGGRVDAKRRGRPRNRQEAKARARSERVNRFDRPPTWRGAINRALIASALFFVLLVLLFQRPLVPSLFFALFMLAFYVPAGYFIDRLIWRRRQRSTSR